MTSPFEMIRNHLSQAVPFANTVGVELGQITENAATATLSQRTETSNHIGTQHAGAMFTLGEAASGAALAGALAPVILQCRPIAKDAKISYVKIAKGLLTATARPNRPSAELLAELSDVGVVVFDVDVDVTDVEGDTVVAMTVTWHVKKT